MILFIKIYMPWLLILNRYCVLQKHNKKLKYTPMKKIFIIVGALNIPKEVVYEVFNQMYGNYGCKCWFVDKEHGLKNRFSFANNNGKKIEAIFIGPVPHKSYAAGKNNSMVTELCIAGSKTPVYVCRNEAGVLKFTKNSLHKAILIHEDYRQKLIQEQKDCEDKMIEEVKKFMNELFFNTKPFP